MCQEHAKLAKEVDRLKGLEANLLSELAEARSVANAAHAQSKTARTFVDALLALIDAPKIAAAYGATADVDVGAIVEKVLARIPTTGAVVQVTPPEQLRRDFQRDEASRILEAAAALTPLARQQLRLLEALEGQAVGQQALAERMGRSWGGNARVTFVKGLDELVALGWIDKQERQGVRTTLRAKIEANLALYQPAVGDVDATYQHVVAALASGAAS